MLDAFFFLNEAQWVGRGAPPGGGEQSKKAGLVDVLTQSGPKSVRARRANYRRYAAIAYYLVRPITIRPDFAQELDMYGAGAGKQGHSL